MKTRTHVVGEKLTGSIEKVMPAVEKIRELEEQAQKELSKKEPHDMEVKK